MFGLSNTKIPLSAFIFSMFVITSASVLAKVDPQVTVQEALSRMAVSSDKEQPLLPSSQHEKTTTSSSKYVPQNQLSPTTDDSSFSFWKAGAFGLLTIVSSKSPSDIHHNLDKQR